MDTEHRGCLLERDVVILDVLLGLVLVPFEPQAHAVRVYGLATPLRQPCVRNLMPG
jgi:hypothetical protein